MRTALTAWGVALGVLMAAPAQESPYDAMQGFLQQGHATYSTGLRVDSRTRVRASRLSIHTHGDGSPALFIAGQGSWLQAADSFLLTEGVQSPAVYCSAGLSLSNCELYAQESPALLLAPRGGATLEDVFLAGRRHATVLMRSLERNGVDGPSLRLKMLRCVLPQVPGVPLFLVDNVQADIVLAHMQVGRVGTRFLQVGGFSLGDGGSRSGNLFLRADVCRLRGDVQVDSFSRVELILGRGTVWHGQFTGGGHGSVSLERGSFWRPGGSCHVSAIDFGGREPEDGVQSILQLPGSDVYYDSAATPGLEGRTFLLPGGGRLTPEG